MKPRSQLVPLAATMTLLIFISWITWGHAMKDAKWDFEALNTLFTGLAFGGLVVTVWIQLTEISELEQSTSKSIKATTRIGNILALSQLRENMVSRIAHLKSLKTDEDFKEEGLPREQARDEIRKIRSRLPAVEKNLEELLGNLIM